MEWEALRQHYGRSVTGGSDFFFAILTFFYMFEVMAVRTSIRSGMHYAGKASAEKAYLISVVTRGSWNRIL